MPLLRHLAALFAFLAAFVRPAPAPAFTPASPETRVAGFEVAAELLFGELGAANLEQHQGIVAAYDENASGYRFAAGGARTLSSSEILFSQSDEIAASMRASAWEGAPVDVLSIEGRLITVDNTRVLAAHLTGTPVQAIVHGAGEALPASMAGRFVSASGVEATTWGEAVLTRIGNQSAGYRSVYPLGSWVTGGGHER